MKSEIATAIHLQLEPVALVWADEKPEGEVIGQQMASAGAAAMADEFLHGERYFKTPELAARFVEGLPIVDIPASYVVLKPIGKDVMTVSVTAKLFHRMEANVEGSFLERPTWQSLAE